MSKNIKLWLTLPLFLAAIILSISWSLTNCTGSSTTVFSDKDSSNYVNYCAGCHGYYMEEFQNRNWMFANSDDEIINIIKKGEEDMGMPGFEQAFSDREIKSLSNYILGKSKEYAKLEKSEKKFKKEAKSGKASFWVETVVTDLDVPWGLEFLPNNELIISERSGKLLKFTSDKKLVEIKGFPPVRAGGQGGLMDIQVHPDFEKNSWIYFSYSYYDETDKSKSNTAILRAKLKGNELYDQEIIYKATPTSTRSHHFGSKIAFDRDGYLYFSVGDRGNRDRNPQTLDNSNGKIHRLYDDGRVPKDNPFYNQKGAIKSIYSFGHRNPQGVTLNPLTGDIWTHEHGPKGGDEINIIKPGLNYGWPVISYGVNYNGTKFTDITEKKGMEQPLALLCTIYCTMWNGLGNR
jgi:glucose/arabinose dehydrogenase